MKKLKQLIKKYFSNLAFFYHYLGNRIILAFVLSVMVSLMDGLGLSMFFPLLQVVAGDSEALGIGNSGNLKYLTDGIENLGIPLSLGSVLILMIVFFIFKGIAFYLSYVYRIILQQSFIRKLRLELLSGLGRMSFKKYTQTDAGRIQNTLSGEVNSLSTAFNAYFGAFEQIVMLLVYIGFAFFLDAKFALLVCVGGVMVNLLYRIIYKKTTVASYKLTNFNNIFQGQIIQYVNHFKYLKATGKEPEYAERLKDTIYKIEDSRKRMGVLSSISGAAREPLMVGIIVLIIFIQIQFLKGNLATMLISLLFFYRGLGSLVVFQQSWNTFLQVSGSLANVKDFQEILKSGRESAGSVSMKNFKHKITLENVSFNYGQIKILNDIHLEINKNESIAFVGESGSGKTTIINLIAGLLPANNGRIDIDDINIDDLIKKTYQDRIGYVSQDAVIFNDTIYNNVSFWAEKTDENLAKFEEAIRQSALKSFIDELPDKEETLLGNNGINLSGGQKQRVSIARELFKDIDLLILDEATSALDSETEKEIQQSIDALQGKYTLLIVAHRLSTVRNVDRVILMDRGKIIDVAGFEELMTRNKKFKRMVEVQ
ncbi:MAG: ABC transporter ATP-binding protein, partial [Weeksellaceae bacterium]|nr:ABC transporter ATP-binding protein [Weeksellaceae bacterium]